MYRKAKRDKNERQIIEFFHRIGATVAQLDDPGIPDLLVGFRGVNILIEVKNDRGSLTELQQEFFEVWQGQATVVRTMKDAKQIIRYINNASIHL